MGKGDQTSWETLSGSVLEGAFGDKGGKSEEEILVLLEQKGKELCLGVEEVLGQRDTVIKPLPKQLGKIMGISGCSILEDGGGVFDPGCSGHIGKG